MARLQPYFSKSHGKPRVDDRRVLSGIVFVSRNGLRWCHAPKDYGPYETLYNRCKRWDEKGGVGQGSGDAQHRRKAGGGIFLQIMEWSAAASDEPKTVMIDATYFKAHRTASSLRVKRGVLIAS